MKKQPKIAVVLPFSPLGGIIYTLFHFHITGMESVFDKNIRFHAISPTKFQTDGDMSNISTHFLSEFGEEPDYLLIFGMHFSFSKIDADIYEKLRFKKTALAIDFLNHSWKTETGASFHVIDSMNSSGFMGDILKAVLFYTNLMKAKEDRLPAIYLNNNRRELLNLGVHYERVVYTNDDVCKLNAIFWSSAAAVYNKPQDFQGKDRDAPDLFLGFRFRMKDGFNGYFKTAYEKASNDSGAQVFNFVQSAPRYTFSLSSVGTGEQKILFVKGEDGLAYDTAAFSLLKQDFSLVLILSHRNDVIYYYNNFTNPVSFAYIEKTFNPITKSDRRGCIPVSDDVIKFISETFS